MTVRGHCPASAGTPVGDKPRPTGVDFDQGIMTRPLGLVIGLTLALTGSAQAQNVRNGGSSGPVVIRPSAPSVSRPPVKPHPAPHAAEARPQHRITPTPHNSSDLFLATPWTYRPHDRAGSGRHSSHGSEHRGDSWHWPGGGWPYLGPLYEPYPGEEEDVAERDEQPAARPSPSLIASSQPVPAAVAAPLPSAAPAPHKTFYVIPMCYAGDVPPPATTSCDLTKLRTIR